MAHQATRRTGSVSCGGLWQCSFLNVPQLFAAPVLITFIVSKIHSILVNQTLLEKIADRDYARIVQHIGQFLLHETRSRNSDGVVLGLSGGVDSATLAYICGRTIQEQTLALLMPDTSVTPRSETDDAMRMISETGISHKLIDVGPIMDRYSERVSPDRMARGNLLARVRANILYYHANSTNCLVLGSSDRSEWLLGYFTKFGDGASDIAPIANLYKLQVRKAAEFLGVPQNVIQKKSSPHLWGDHTAEGELGATYEEIDAALYCLNEMGLSAEQAAAEAQLDIPLVERIRLACQRSGHKRALPARPEDLTP